MDTNALNYGNNSGYAASFYDPNTYGMPDQVYDGGDGSGFDNEPPLLEG